MILLGVMTFLVLLQIAGRDLFGSGWPWADELARYSGLGLGVGINLSGKPKDIVSTELQIQIRRRSDQAAIWEGRASTESREGTPESQPRAVAQKLAAALLGGYPGESGRTITVK